MVNGGVGNESKGCVQSTTPSYFLGDKMNGTLEITQTQVGEKEVSFWHGNIPPSVIITTGGIENPNDLPFEFNLWRKKFNKDFVRSCG